MKELKKEMKTVMRDLKQLTKKAEKLGAKIVKLESTKKAKPAAKPKAKPKAKASAKPKAARSKKVAVSAKKAAPKKAKKMTASDTILGFIRNSSVPVDTTMLKKKTKFKDNNIRMIVYRLKKRGEIKSVRKGVYEKA